MQECNHCGNQLEVILWYRKPHGLQVFSSTINTVNTLYSRWTQVEGGGGVTAINGKAYEQLGKSKLDPPPPPQKAFESTHLAKHHSAINREPHSNRYMWWINSKVTCLPAITALNLAAWIKATISTEECNPLKQFWNIFKGLGTSANSLLLNSNQMQLHMHSTNLTIYHYLFDQSTRRAWVNGVPRCQTKSWWANTMVCWDGGGAQKSG